MNRIKEVYSSSKLRKIVIFSTISLLFEMATSLILLMYGVINDISLDSFIVWTIPMSLSLISILPLLKNDNIVYFSWSGIFWWINSYINKFFIYLNPIDNLLSIQGIILSFTVVCISVIYFVTSRSLEHKNKNPNGGQVERTKQDIESLSEDAQLAIVKKDGLLIRIFKNPSKSVQLAAVKENGLALRYIEFASESVQLTAVKNNGSAIKFIKNPSEKVQLEAVKQNGLAIKFIKNPSEKVQLEAVKQNGLAIQCVDNSNKRNKNITIINQRLDDLLNIE